MKPTQVLVACPQCGHTQREPPTAYSTVCKGCGRHFRVQEVLHPTAKPAPPPRDVRQVACFKCGAEMEVPAAAQSTMCKRCSTHVDLRDYQIASAVSKNFKTKGRFVIEPNGFLFNTDSIVGEGVIKGRLIGQLNAERSLEIHSTAEIKGRFQAGRLIIPAGHHFRWPEPIVVGGAEIAGELVAGLLAQQTVVLKSTARLFGDVRAANLVVEEGAVFVGAARIGNR